MASLKVLESKKETVSEILENIKTSESVILFQYQGLTVSELSDLRKKLRDADATVKVYKNTLLKRALDEQKKEVRELVMAGLEQIKEGKTKDFNTVCDRLEKKYRDEAISN